jgi:hypothetical protein
MWYISPLSGRNTNEITDEGNPGPMTKFPGAFDAKDPGKFCVLTEMEEKY